MVFLRLTVKVLPRELVHKDPVLRDPSLASERDANSVVANEAKPEKVIAFLVPIPNPEEVTLGALAGLIQKQWVRLRPNSG